MVGFVFDGEGGGQHHQASARLTRRGVPRRRRSQRVPRSDSPDGLRPWQAKKYYYTAALAVRRRRGRRALTGEGASSMFMFTGGDAYDPALGRTCNEIAGEARSMHKCQGMSQLLPLPGVNQGFGSGPRAYRLRDTVLPDGVNRPDPEMFDGVDTALVEPGGLRRRAAAGGAGGRRSTRIASSVADARAAVAAKGSTAAVRAAGRRAEGGARAACRRSARHGTRTTPAATRSTSGWRRRSGSSSRRWCSPPTCGSRRWPATAWSIAGQPVQLRVIAANRGARRDHRRGDAGRLDLAGRRLRGRRRSRPAARATASSPRTVPADARLTAAHFKYATTAAQFVLDPDVPPGLPFRPTPFVGQPGAASSAGKR